MREHDDPHRVVYDMHRMRRHGWLRLMSLADIEVVMHGSKPIRTIITLESGETFALEGVTNVGVDLGVGGPAEVKVTMYAHTINVRQAFGPEIGSGDDGS